MSDSNSKSTSEDSISLGNYIVIQRHNYFKLHQLTEGVVLLGKDKVDLKNAVGHSFWTTFKMVPKTGGKREFILEICKKAESLSDSVMKDVMSGSDNRNISDDGRSQLLTTEEIIGLRESGLSTQGIVGMLIENSKTFASKTEYSQEKYLKKKEKKYFEYLIIRKPTIRLLAEIFFNKDQFKVMGLRYDTLSQIITYSNIQPRGTYILYECGSQALIGAAILNYLGEKGTLINLSQGNQPQKQAILAMNFNNGLMANVVNVKAKSLVQNLFKDSNGTDKNPEGLFENKEHQNDLDTQLEETCCLQNDDKAEQKVVDDSSLHEEPINTVPRVEVLQEGENRKRKIVTNFSQRKRPRWEDDLQRAIDILTQHKADGLIVSCKEFPLNLVLKLIPFIKPSRPLVIYSLLREPLIDIYLELKKRKDVIGLHLTETWLRSYQVLPDRTHPDVMMSSSGGHILKATVVK